MTTPSARLADALAGGYRIERELGAGGMATVYLAQDLKHDRKVAIKVLKPELAAVLGAERFLVEIKTTAALQHPHILPLFDSGTADGFLYYVMPFIEGETLRDRLNRETQLGIEAAVRIATDVADALEYAHGKGVIHRDIKPENILLANGRPIVADFGIALAVSAAAGGRMTETGLSLGTPHYMSPEQATAEKDITARSDIYSLASVLYEMLTGSPPHTGASAQQVIMKIIAEPVAAVTVMRKSVPPNVAAAVIKGLEKLPADRFESARAFGEALANPAFTTLETRGQRGPAAPWQMNRLAMLMSGVAAVSMIAAWLALARANRADAGASPPPMTVQVRDSAPSAFWVTENGGILYYQSGALWMRAAGATTFAEAVRLPELMQLGPLSPDGESIVTQQISKTNEDWALLRMRLVGGATTPIATGRGATAGRMFAWGDDGYIYLQTYSRDTNGSAIVRVPASGGTLDTVIALPGTSLPQFVLPGSRGVLMTVAGNVIVLNLATGDTMTVATGAQAPRWSATGHVLFVRSDRVLSALPFDGRRLRPTGPPIAVLDSVAAGALYGQYAVSRSGTLVYARGYRRPIGGSEALNLVGLDGRRTRLRVQFPAGANGTLSPDGRWLAYVRQGNIWLHDLELGTNRQLTTSTGLSPIWSPDGQRVAFASPRAAGDPTLDIYVQPVTGDSPAVLLGGTDRTDSPRQWLEDGTILIDSRSMAGRFDGDIHTLNAGRPGAPTPVLQADWDESDPAVSSDRRWLAYVSSAPPIDGGAGRVWQIIVRAWPALRRQTMVAESTSPLYRPFWSTDGTLYYRDGTKILAVTFQGRDSLRVSGRRTVIDSIGLSSASLHPDQRRFLVAAPDQQAITAQAPRLMVITNWFTTLRSGLRVGRTP
jgi:hypothetical protein